MTIMKWIMMPVSDMSSFSQRSKSCVGNGDECNEKKVNQFTLAPSKTKRDGRKDKRKQEIHKE